MTLPRTQPGSLLRRIGNPYSVVIGVHNRPGIQRMHTRHEKVVDLRCRCGLELACSVWRWLHNYPIRCLRCHHEWLSQLAMLKRNGRAA